MSNGKSAKSKAPKGKPAGTGRKGSGLQEAHAASDPITEDEIAEAYTKKETGELADNVPKRHENRNKDKGRDDQGNENTSE